MCNKNRLKGENVYVPHDLIWKDRKRQEKIRKWVKKKQKRKRG